jgi:hypothetical protein
VPVRGRLARPPRGHLALATGLVEGILAASGSDRRVAEHDNHPERRRCTLRLTSVRGR